MVRGYLVGGTLSCLRLSGLLVLSMGIAAEWVNAGCGPKLSESCNLQAFPETTNHSHLHHLVPRTTAQVFPFVFSSLGQLLSSLLCCSSIRHTRYVSTQAQAAAPRQTREQSATLGHRLAQAGTRIHAATHYISHDAFIATQSRPPSGQDNHGSPAAATIASLLLYIFTHSPPRQLLGHQWQLWRSSAVIFPEASAARQHHCALCAAADSMDCRANGKV